jgi:hypothetical protein
LALFIRIESGPKMEALIVGPSLQNFPDRKTALSISLMLKGEDRIQHEGGECVRECRRIDKLPVSVDFELVRDSLDPSARSFVGLTESFEFCFDSESLLVQRFLVELVEIIEGRISMFRTS